MRCRGQTKSGRQCRNTVSSGTPYCGTHYHQAQLGEIAVATVGGLVGNAIVPGFGGVIGGATAFSAMSVYRESLRSAKKKVFVSFDYDNDRALKHFIVGQSKLPDSPFEVIDHSLKEAAPEAHWEKRARAAIQRSDVVIVIVGRHTYRAKGVLKEVAMARRADKFIVQIIGYRQGPYTPVPNAGRLYDWNWTNLQNILS